MLSCIYIIFCGFLCQPRLVAGLPETVKIAGIFDENVSQQTYDAFRYAIQGINEGRRSLALPGTKLVPRIIQDFKADLFTGPQQICAIAEEGIAAIFGPQRRLSSSLMASIANSTAIPHLMTRWRIKEDHPNTGVNLHPHHTVLGRAHTALIRHFNWTSFALLYDDAESLIRASDLLDGMNELRPDVFKINPTNVTTTLADVKASGVSFIVLDCPGKVAYKVLKAAQKMKMTTYYFHYILTTWDIHLLDLEEIVQDFVNITALQMIDVEDLQLIKAAKGWGAVEPVRAATGDKGKLGVTTEAALIYDSVQLLVKSVRRAEEEGLVVTPEPVFCSRRQKWGQGGDLYRHILNTKFKGLTGEVSFDRLGHRSNVRLHVVEPLRFGLQKVGYWTVNSGVKIDFNYTGYRTIFQNSIKNKLLRVLVKLENPYIMEKPNASLYEGNDRYRGFCIDMLHNLSLTLNFSYELVVSDLSYGDQDPDTKEWNGLVRELIDKKGDMVLGAMSITRDREEVVDFSQPFLYLGVRILLKKPEKKTPALFAFLDPLSVAVWIFILVGFLVMSCVMFVIGRFSPYEWYNPNPCVEEAGVVENQFSIFNAMWFAIGSLMQVGTEIAPRAISTRFLAGIWWFFTMIIVGSYTANLAAYLTAERMQLPIENAHDLVEQNQIKYGCLEGGATCKFFERSVYPDYVRMWDTIKADPNNFVKSHAEGVARVKEAKGGPKGYAYLMESITMEYITSRDCSVIGIGNPLDTKGYGVAFPKNSPFRKEISVSILTQQDKGFLEEFRVKWWKTEDGGNTCEDVKATSGTNAMGLDMVGGVFVVVLLGVGLGLIVALVEFTWKAKRNPEDYKESLAKEIWKTLKGAFRHPFALSKPLVRASTARQLCEDDVSTTVPNLTHQGHGFSKNF
ncbi:Glutamate receptor ionotropic, kainate 2 [Hypsibius exemplaris]|uniref:Glutamate receptor ionotropic, kainate 2 n=1 Tax=Hypsibius exemplaris TaxID=2072580 RepID=A0A1W0X6N0_HYPEX|nr:Glutamate receptor ionotropic, kainate 2 [Hypsibius exemplaris]